MQLILNITVDSTAASGQRQQPPILIHINVSQEIQKKLVPTVFFLHHIKDIFELNNDVRKRVKRIPH